MSKNPHRNKKGKKREKSAKIYIKQVKLIIKKHRKKDLKLKRHKSLLFLQIHQSLLNKMKKAKDTTS